MIDMHHAGPRIGSLFSGYGGLEMGVQAVLGGTVAWHVEFDAAPSKVLAHHHPDVPNYGDITTVDWDAVEPIDILTGGVPCQDVSHAGKRLGLRPDTRTGLWLHMAYAIDRLRPQLVVFENVGGILSASTDQSTDVVRVGPRGGRKVERTNRALGRVLADLAEMGYDAAWGSVRAADAGAPHGRLRVFLLAFPSDSDLSRLEGWRLQHCGRAGERPAGAGGVEAGVGLERFGEYAPAVARWERVLGRRAPEPTEPSRKGGRQLAPAFVEWMMGLPTGWVTAPEIGLTRAQALKALGNGVCPQQAALAISLVLGLPVAAAQPDGPVLKTPTAQLAINGGSQHPAKRRAGGHGPTLADEVEHLLPTPAVNGMGEGKSVEAWDAWTERMRAAHRNGNGHGRSLAIEAARLAAD